MMIECQKTGLRFAVVALAMLLLGSMLSLPAHARCDKGETEIRVGTWFDEDHLPRVRFMDQFESTVNRELQGKACVSLVTDQAAFKGAQGLAALQENKVHLLAMSFEDLGGLDPFYQTFQTPFAFRNLAALERFQAAQSVSVFKVMDEKGYRPLAFLHGEFDHFISRNPVYTPQDLAGKRIWRREGGGYGEAISAYKAIGQTATENQLELIIKQERLDVAPMGWVEMDGTGVARLMGHALESHMRFKGYQIMGSKQHWDRFDSNLRNSLLQIIRRLIVQVNFETTNRIEGAMRKLIRSGVKVGTLTEHQREQFRTALAGLRTPLFQTSPALVEALAKANGQL